MVVKQTIFAQKFNKIETWTIFLFFWFDVALKFSQINYEITPKKSKNYIGATGWTYGPIRILQYNSQLLIEL